MKNFIAKNILLGFESGNSLLIRSGRFSQFDHRSDNIYRTHDKYSEFYIIYF